MEKKHMPTPWRMGATFIYNGTWVTSVLDARGECVVAYAMGSESRPGYTDEDDSWEKAEAIVLAHNAHDDLVAIKEAAEQILAAWNSKKAISGLLLKQKVDAANAAIAKACGGE